MVFYRKYRPQKIEDLDSEAVRNSLYSIFANKDLVPHAFLFSGPKGLGKTSTARIVAKVINCEKHDSKLKVKNQKSELEEKEIEPCDKCFQCTSITNGTNFDVFEIDGASNRGIDEIRDLKEKINLLPTKSSKKIYIIDEVHMLTTEAFNALLKTLEEPPSHAVFILCTTELHKVPQTIISRCFRVDFTKATEKDLERSLNRIIRTEKIKIDKEVLLEIAKMSDGSFRDGVKILEELVLTAGEKTITLKILEEKYNTLGIEKSLQDLINVFKTKDAQKGFEITNKLTEQGMDFKFFIEKLMDRFHLMLLTKVGVSKENESDFSVLEIKNILELLTKAHQETKYAVLPQLPLELAIVEFVSRGPAGSFQSAPVEQASSFVRSASAPSSLVNSNEVRAVGNPSSSVTPPGSKSPSLANRKNEDEDFYKNFIIEVKNHNNLLAGVLRSCTIEDSKGNNLEILAISKFHKEKLEEPKSIIILEEAAGTLLNKKITVSITMK